jgi:hypothetical protein
VNSGAAAGNGASATGGGGGGGATTAGAAGTGGSGIVVLRWNAAQAQINLSAGLVSTSTVVGSDKVVTITAGTGLVSWS